MKIVVPIVIALIMFAVTVPVHVYASDVPWIKYPRNPILSPTLGGWDSNYVNAPRVVFDGRIFRMWYNGGNSSSSGIGYATSNDGIVWSKYVHAVLTPGTTGSWDSSAVELGSVMENGSMFLMWYRGINPTSYDNGAIGMANSTDGITWTKYAENPVLTASNLDQQYVASPYVIRLQLTFNMWYTGRNVSGSVNRILYATSYDGINWSKWPTAVLSPSADAGAWDGGSIYSPSVFYDGSNFGIWYTGLNQSFRAPRIGFAISLDGAKWTRFSANPILTPGTRGSWDSAGVEQSDLVLTGSGYFLYYDGSSRNSGGQIGLAFGPQGFAVPEFQAPILAFLVAAGLCLLSFRRTSPRKARS